jgi:hypothetical protein
MGPPTCGNVVERHWGLVACLEPFVSPLCPHGPRRALPVVLPDPALAVPMPGERRKTAQDATWDVGRGDGVARALPSTQRGRNRPLRIMTRCKREPVALVRRRTKLLTRVTAAPLASIQALLWLKRDTHRPRAGGTPLPLARIPAHTHTQSINSAISLAVHASHPWTELPRRRGGPNGDTAVPRRPRLRACESAPAQLRSVQKVSDLIDTLASTF